MELKDFKVGDRVRIHPATDWSARGVAWVTVLKVGRKLLTVKTELFDKTFTVSPRNVVEID